MMGREIMVEAYGCNAERLTSIAHLSTLFTTIVRELSLHPIGETQWHQFPEPGGITGLCMLAESHLTLHTFPEYASACLNLFCCTPRADWAWAERLETLLGASHVTVRSTLRHYAQLEPQLEPQQQLHPQSHALTHPQPARDSARDDAAAIASTLEPAIRER